MDQKPNIERQLIFWFFIVGAFATPSLFFKISSSSLKADEYFRTASDWLRPHIWWQFISSNGMAFWLGLAVFAIFFSATSAAKNDFITLKNLFTLSRTPQDWQAIKLYKIVPALIVWFMGGFCYLFWMLGNIFYFSLGMLAWNVQDHLNYTAQSRNLMDYLDDPVYRPAPMDEHRPFIEERRIVARHYLLQLPQRVRIFGVTLGTLIAIALAASADYGAKPHLRFYAYAAMLSTIVLNELGVGWWRHKATAKLTDIETRQRLADMQRLVALRQELTRNQE